MKKIEHEKEESVQEIIQEKNKKNLNKKFDISDEFEIENFPIISATSKIDTQYISALLVRNKKNLIIGGRWFGIWDLEKSDNNLNFDCNKRIVNQCKFVLLKKF